MSRISFYLFCLVLLSGFYASTAGVRRKRQDFVFPDDDGGIPARFTTPIQGTTRPSTTAFSVTRPAPTQTTTTAPGVMRSTPSTTPSPQHLECLKGCPTTSEYNPVCGTDQQLYFNEQKLMCAQRCGHDVEILRRANCRNLFS